MSMLAIDIVTVNDPSNQPADMEDTANLELIAVALGYQDRPGASVETDVLFRDGDWGIEGTTRLLTHVEQWVKSREPNYAITYNGDQVEKTHLLNWAEHADEKYQTTTLTETFTELFENHVALSRPAAELYGDDDQTKVSLSEAFDEAGISVSQTQYQEYSLPTTLTDQFGQGCVQDTDVERVLGEAYVDHVATAASAPEMYANLQSLMYDYSVADIEPLFELSENLRQTI